jgi:hypothetical protein
MKPTQTQQKWVNHDYSADPVQAERTLIESLVYLGGLLDANTITAITGTKAKRQKAEVSKSQAGDWYAVSIAFGDGKTRELVDVHVESLHGIGRIVAQFRDPELGAIPFTIDGVTVMIPLADERAKMRARASC